MSETSIYLVCGEPGVGKTTVAKEICGRTGAELVRTDEERTHLFGDDPEYTTGETLAVYSQVFHKLWCLMRDHDDIVLDGTFRMEEWRNRVRTITETNNTDLIVVRVVCDEDTVVERIRSRTDDASDADVDVYRTVRDEFEAVSGEHIVVDNSQTWPTTLDQIDQIVPP